MTDTLRTDELDETTPLHVWRRRLILTATVVIVLAILALIPPLINGEHFRHRIATSMSQSLGRPVHIDKVSFHLLPVPGITLGNLVVSEDPAFGNEPVIRANVVEATLRISSLWRRQIEVSRINFKTDENGSGASVNIVRNVAGQWNLDNIFMQAAHVNTAPTAQLKAGPAPRFPYIEATGARINLKLGNEKMPFSVTDVDFALWLPSPQQWHIRLQGKPARTDTNTNDTGTLRIEGTLGQAATLVDIPLSLAGSWAHAQMGEASRLFTGNDEGWRGTLETGITLTGTVGAAQLDTNLHVTDLRRADFVPAKLLDVSAHCTTAADIATLTITQAACAIPTGSAQPILISSPSLDLQEPGKAAITIALNQMPFAWALDWSRLFAQRVPNSTSATGTLDGQLTHPSNGDGIWSATLQSILVYANTPNRAYDFTSAPITTDWTGTLTPTSSSLAFQLSAPQPGTSRPLSFAGQLAPDQFGFTFDGVATMEQLQTFGNAILPPLGDDAVKSLKPAATESPIPVELACTLPHAAPETCTLERREPTPPPKSRHKH